MNTHNAISRSCSLSNNSDVDCRCVRCQDALFIAMLLKVCKDLLLKGDVFQGCFDDHV